MIRNYCVSGDEFDMNPRLETEQSESEPDEKDVETSRARDQQDNLGKKRKRNTTNYKIISLRHGHSLFLESYFTFLDSLDVSLLLRSSSKLKILKDKFSNLDKNLCWNENRAYFAKNLLTLLKSKEQ
ncbi:hypothetical protein BpHYR1_031349 [Brachionus plicatilis]|uniref:Uncharacterized protein n=1 Tax=Brachionus plicatilis TaxID=10195 RepID=A0A3M7R079_BRAPC|nr:hypothetical protein BpHYR1_031349 [Brachionus plicatilis]